MGSWRHLIRYSCVVCCAGATLFGGRSADASEATSGAVEHASIGPASEGDWTLVPTAHPAVPRELSYGSPLLARTLVSSSSVLARLASGVALYRPMSFTAKCYGWTAAS